MSEHPLVVFCNGGIVHIATVHKMTSGRISVEKVLACVERIHVVKGVSGGFITNEQVDSLCSIFGLDEQQKQQVLVKLEENGIVPIAEEDVPEKYRPAPPESPQPKEVTPEEREQIYKERFTEEFEKFQRAIEDEPELARQYQRQIPVLKQALADQHGDTQSTTMEKVMAAVLYLSRYRARPYRRRGWVCVHASHEQ